MSRRRMGAGAAWLLVGALVWALPSGHLAAQESSDETAAPIVVHPQAEKAISELRSPFCPGLMLEICPSPNAAALRDTLAMLADEGISSDSLVAMVIANYGEEWRALPQRSGMGLAAWVLPPLFLLLGAVLVFAVLSRRKGARPPSAGSSDPELTDVERERLDEALRAFEESEETVF